MSQKSKSAAATVTGKAYNVEGRAVTVTIPSRPATYQVKTRYVLPSGRCRTVIEDVPCGRTVTGIAYNVAGRAVRVTVPSR